jgi:hypothetical protein
MKIITFLSVTVTLILSIWIWNIASDTRLLSSQIQNTKDEISALNQEKDSLLKYKSQTPNSLEKFYLKVFSDIKEVCSYYHVPCELIIVGAKDFVNTREFFRESQYKGIRYVDISCRVDLKDKLNPYLFDMLSRFLKSAPIEILEVRLEKNILNLTLRLYGT